MKANYWIKRILVSLMVFCLAVTGFGVQPAQASPPVDDDLPNYILTAEFERLPAKPICQGTKTTIGFWILIEQEGGKSYRTTPFKTSEVNISAKHGKVSQKTLIINDLMLMKKEHYEFEYTVPKKDSDTVTVSIYVPGGLVKTIDAPFKLQSCKSSIHGTADMGATANALSPGDTWNFVGTYDVAGTVEMNEGGMANGQGTASMFMDGVAAESQVGCEFTSPIQGNTTVEVKADPEAWANGSLQLQIHLESMPVSFGGIGCTSFGGEWNTGGAAVTTASFDLDPVSLPANGGATSLEFQLPDQPGTFKMDLIAVIEEAES